MMFERQNCPVEINKHRQTDRQTDVHTCNLDDSGDPVDFTGQDCVGVQDLHLHPDGDVIPLGIQWNLKREVRCFLRDNQRMSYLLVVSIQL